MWSDKILAAAARPGGAEGKKVEMGGHYLGLLELHGLGLGNWGEGVRP